MARGQWRVYPLKRLIRKNGVWKLDDYLGTELDQKEWCWKNPDRISA